MCQSSTSGGAEAYLVRLYAALADRGMSPELLGSCPGWSASGLPSVDMGFSPKWSRKTIVSGLTHLASERKVVKRRTEHMANSLFHLQFKREQIGFTDVLADQGPVIWTEHGRFSSGPQTRLLATAYKAAAKRVSAIICVSEGVASDVRAVVGPKARIETIPNAVDTSVLRPASQDEKTHARARLGIPDGLPVMLWLGRIHPAKLPRLTVEIAPKWPGIILVAGSGPMFGELAAAGAPLGPRLRFLGHVSETASLYHASDVMLFSSTGAGEGLPTTLIEAAAYGLPVVTNHDSGFANLIISAGGKSVNRVSGPDVWARVALGLISDSVASGQARRWARSYDIQPWLNAHAALFASLNG